MSAKKLNNKRKLKYFKKYIENYEKFDSFDQELVVAIITPDKDIVPESDILKPALNKKKIFFFKNLNFKNIDKKKFPIIKLKKRLIEYNSTPIIINAANEILVDQFLKKKISFISFSRRLFKLLDDRNYSKYAIKVPKNVNQVMQIDQWARQTMLKMISSNKL